MQFNISFLDFFFASFPFWRRSENHFGVWSSQSGNDIALSLTTMSAASESATEIFDNQLYLSE
jgi:hypothetical protein